MPVISTSTVFYKRVFPLFWLLVCTLALVGPILAGVFAKVPLVVVGPLFMAAVGYFVMRLFILDLADEVKDGGSFLVVRRGAVEDRVQLANVMNVNMTQYVNPPRLSLRLRTPGKFGDEVVFIPKMPGWVFNRFARNAIAENLIKRVDRARQEAR